MVAGAGSRPRLCLLLPHVLLGGGETAMMAAAEGLLEDFDVAVRALDYGPEPRGLTVRGELAARFGDVGFVRRRWELLPVLRAADAVLWYGLTNAVPRALERLGGGRPASVRAVHTERPEEVSFHRRFRAVIDATVCVSPAMGRRLAGSVFLPNTCSLASLRGPREVFFPGTARKTLGFLGRLAPLKNVPWLVENVERLGCNLLVQGIDTEEVRVADLERLAADRGVSGRVRFLAPGRDAGTLLRSVDALVVASAHEGFPMVVVEAGMLGVPVIATRVGALPEVFGEEILFFDSRDGVPAAGSLREALARVGPEWGARLREKVGRLCSREAVARGYGDLLREALRARLEGRIHLPTSQNTPATASTRPNTRAAPSRLRAVAPVRA